MKTKPIPKILSPAESVALKFAEQNEARRLKTIAYANELLRKAYPDWANNGDVLKHTISIISSLRILEIAANAGDSEAHSVIVNLAIRTCATTDQLLTLHRLTTESLSRDCNAWPLLLNFHPEERAAQLRILTELPIAENLPWKKPGRKPYKIGAHPDTVRANPNRIVKLGIQKLLFQISHTNTVLSLPRLGSSTAANMEWFEAIWKELLTQWDGRPEKRPDLRPLGIHVAEAKKATYKPGSKSYESLVRDGIRKCLKRAFRTIIREVHIQDK